MSRKRKENTRGFGAQGTNTQGVSTQGFSRLRQREAMMRICQMAGMDGFTNPAAFLGEASPLMASGTFVRSGLTRNIDLLTRVYRENWLARRIIDTPAEDMSRAWYSLATGKSKEDLDELARLEARHSVKQEITNAIRWALLYGGSLALMVIRGEEDRLETPLDTGVMLMDDFQGLLVLDRTMGIEPSEELVKDLDDPDFGLPEYYSVCIGEEMRQVKIHHSRVLQFIGRELPHAEAEREQYWGTSELEHVWDELIKISNVSANIAQLVFKANITALKRGDLGEMINLGTDESKEAIFRTMELENRFRTSYGVQLLNSNDSMETFSYSFGGLSEVYEQFMMNMAGAAEIPATKLFGRSPQGLNATGESDLRNYYERIASLQERMLRPALEKLIPVMAVSCWLEAPEDMRILFEPVKTMGATEQVKLAAEHTRMVLEAFEKGIISKGEALDELKGMSGKTNIWAKLEGGEMNGEGQQDGRDSGRVSEDLSAGGMEDSGFDFGSRDAAGGGGAADWNGAGSGFREG